MASGGEGRAVPHENGSLWILAHRSGSETCEWGPVPRSSGDEPKSCPFWIRMRDLGGWKQPCLRAGVDGVTPGCEGGRAPGGEPHPGVVRRGGWGDAAGPWWCCLPRFRVTWTDADVSASPIPRSSFAVGSSQGLDVPLR